MSEDTRTASVLGVPAALEALRAAVKAQVGTDRPGAADVDPSALARFSPTLSREPAAADTAALRERAESLGPWLQGPFWLGGDVVVGGTWRCDRRWLSLSEQVPSDLRGMRVLDVGSNAGYDPFMFKVRGADYVLACEPFEFLHQARFLESIYCSGVDFREIGWQALDPDVHGLFDLVHCNGVLYHELHMVRMLQRLRRMLKPRGTLLLGTMMLADAELSEYARFIPDAYYADPTWWWVPGRLATRWMLDAAGLEVEREFAMTDGPPGEFATVNGYLRARPGDPLLPAEVGATELPGEDASETADQPGIRRRPAAQSRLWERLAADGPPRVGNLDGWIRDALLRAFPPNRAVRVGAPVGWPYPVAAVTIPAAESAAVSPETFADLQSGDVLSIATAQVPEALGRLLTIVLPRLRRGVLVELESADLSGERAHPRAELLQAFLLFNDGFDVVLETRHAIAHHPDAFVSVSGSALWLRRA